VSRRLVALPAFLVCAGVVAAALLQTTGRLPSTVIKVTSDWLWAVGAPPMIAHIDHVQFILNALMFTPLVVLGAVLVPRVRWSEWVVLAFVISGAVELFQGFVLPSRYAEFADVVANTLGALLGALLVQAVRLVRRKRTPRRT